MYDVHTSHGPPELGRGRAASIGAHGAMAGDGKVQAMAVRGGIRLRRGQQSLRREVAQADFRRLLATNPNKCDHFPMISSHARPYGRFRGPALTISARRPRGRHVRTLIRATWKSEV